MLIIRSQLLVLVLVVVSYTNAISSDSFYYDNNDYYYIDPSFDYMDDYGYHSQQHKWKNSLKTPPRDHNRSKQGKLLHEDRFRWHTKRNSDLNSYRRSPSLAARPLKTARRAENRYKADAVKSNRKAVKSQKSHSSVSYSSHKKSKETVKAEKSKELKELVQHLYVAQARVQVEASEIQKAQTLANEAQQQLEEAANHARAVTAALQSAQQEVASAAIRAQTAQLQLAAHDQLLFAARQDVDALSSRMVGLQAAQNVAQPSMHIDISQLMEKLKQPSNLKGKTLTNQKSAALEGVPMPLAAKSLPLKSKTPLEKRWHRLRRNTYSFES